jgi:hypothetical protein
MILMFFIKVYNKNLLLFIHESIKNTYEREDK